MMLDNPAFSAPFIALSERSDVYLRGIPTNSEFSEFNGTVEQGGIPVTVL